MRPTDGRVITNPENAQSFSHAEIKQAADQMNPNALSGAVDAWAAIATAVTDAGKRFESAIQSAITEHWEGVAADAAVRGIREFAAKVGELGEALGRQSAPIAAAGNAASQFQAAIPAVPDSSSSSATPEVRNSVEEQARDDMVTYYIRPYATTAPEIPTLPAPAHPAVTAPGGTGTSPLISTPGASGAAATSPITQPPVESGASATGQATQPVSPVPAGATPATTPEATTPQPGTGAAGTPPQSTDPAATNPQTTASPNGVPQTAGSTASTIPASASTIPASASTVPASASTLASLLGASTSRASTPQPIQQGTSPAAAAPAPSQGGTGPVRSDVPASSQAPAQNSGQAPRPGASVPAQPAAQSAPAQPAAAPARPAVAGSSGYAGMGPAGARGRGEGDGEHRSPRYLRTEEHAAELLGEPERTVPPVLGAD
ncbi:hypothetical protein [Nocardia bovistercoris]|uniref:PPE domain-containing protein n=1 Tax=Nocardia bovistercoris TaxID=2785916 RepID=A0A931I944_9NOCA|nr:hypothetical protein [Nocardia bovistercoris]MBH0775997.1 hypothetical protein [Nocardia bovistercoris]